MGDLKLDSDALYSFIEKEWDSHIIDTLCEYIKIPNQSPLFDKTVLTNGHMDKAVTLFVNWVKEQKLSGLSIKVVRSEGRTPVILTNIEGDGKTDDTVLLYGHLDKQPPLTSEWAEGLSPYTPVIKEGKLYGRGGADDGYAIFSAISAIKAIQKQKIPHARCVILIEASEESGSPDLEFYVESLKDDIGTPSLVICLDSGCGNYEQLWLTTSLRGNVTAELKVRILKEGVHSGAASGVVPSTFRIQRILLDRIEDAKTGKMLDDLYCEIPKHHIAAAKEIAETLGDEIFKNFPFIEGAKTVSDDLVETILNRTWRPTLCVTGASGLPSLADAGNVLRQETAFKLSIRTPPLVDPAKVTKALHKALTADPPYGAKVGFVVEKSGKGWMAPAHEEWLDKAVTESSMDFFKKPVRYIGEGGSIPFMAMLGERFPSTQFVILGVLGPQSNAHGPNEFLHIQMAKNVTCCVASIIARHFARSSSKDKDGDGAKRRRVERSKI